MKKYVLLAMCLMAGTSLFVSCSNDDEEVKDTYVIPTGDEEFPPVFLNPDEMPEAGIVIQSRLWNEKGDHTTVFKAGEDIVFEVSIFNLTDDKVWIQDPVRGEPRLFRLPIKGMSTDAEDVEKGLFNIHTADGKLVGYPYDTKEPWYVHLTMARQIPINPEQSLHWFASWKGNLSEAYMCNGSLPISAYLVEHAPLAPGAYYTEFDVNLTKDIKKTVRINFTITE